MKNKFYTAIFSVFLLNLMYAQFPKITQDTLDLGEVKNKYELPKKVDENSGLQLIGNKLYTFNDSGGKNEVYVLDLQGKYLQEIELKEATNHDWEDITYDGKRLYVNDGGNNLGNRKNLKIYYFNFDKIKKDLKVKKEKNKGKNFDVPAHVLEFEYAKQTDFPTNSNRQTDYDCEAIVYYNGKIHLFSKEWTSFKTKHYVLDPSLKEKQSLTEIESFDVGMLVTGADIIDGTLYLVGYTKDGVGSLYQFEIDPKTGLFFQKKKKKTYLGFTPAIGQIEAITGNSKGLYISGEEIKVGLYHTPQTLYYIPFTK